MIKDIIFELSNQNNMTHTTADRLVEYKGKYYTGVDIEAMREWISDCQWGDLDTEDIADLSELEVLAGVHRSYDGGLPAFMSDNSL